MQSQKQLKTVKINMASSSQESIVQKEALIEDKHQSEGQVNNGLSTKRTQKSIKTSRKASGQRKKYNESQNNHQKQPKLISFWKNANCHSDSLTKTNGGNYSNREYLRKKMQQEHQNNNIVIQKIIKQKDILKDKYKNLHVQSTSYKQKTKKMLEKAMREVSQYKRQAKSEINSYMGWYIFNDFKKDKNFEGNQVGKIFVQGKFITQIKKKVEQKKKYLAQLKNQLNQNQCELKINKLAQVKVLQNELKHLQKQYEKRSQTIKEYKLKLYVAEKQKFCRYAILGWPIIEQRYLTMELLGKGGFGQVYKCFDLQKNQYVALKINQVPSQPKFQGQSDLVLKHIKRQVQIHKKLDHPNITKIISVLQISYQQVSFFIEYCEGPQLSKYLKQNICLEQSDAKQIIRQILCALKYLYEQPSKIIHYDLKPSNIMFHQGTIKVLDFGLCKQIAMDETKIDLTSQGVGTLWYLPPQTFFADYGNGIKISSKVDIWSTGVIFYELLYGVKPFGHGLKQNNNKLLQIIADAKKVKFPAVTPLGYRVSDQAKKFICQCLKYNQDERLNPLQAYGHPYMKK